ncbi:MAG: MFS transporter [Oscillospiraceae bacterium]|nr:MFS transporter [Oscillospiraceae bacterium]
MKEDAQTYSGSLRDTVSDLCRDNSDGCAEARRALLGSGYLTIFAQAISSGTFFTALLIAMGADETYIGYVTMATTLCMIAQFPAPLFWERRKTRKALILIMGAAGDFLTYLGLPCTALLPLGTEWKLAVYMLLTLFSGIINQFCLPARNAWMMQSIPFAKRVSYASLTSMINTVINVVSVFLAGILLDSFENSTLLPDMLPPALYAIFVLRFIAYAASVGSTLWMAFRVREFSYNMEEAGPVRMSVLLEPVRNRPFFRLVLIPCLWAMFGGMIGSYFSLHLIENVKMSYTVISTASFINTPTVLLITPVWTRILRQKDWIRTMAWAMLGYCAAYCCNVLISAQTPYFYFIAIILGHLFSPGISMVSNNLIYVHMPEENRTAYFACYSLLTTVFTFVGQAFGTWFVTAAASVRIHFIGIPICNLQLISGVAAVCGAVLALYLLLTKKKIER